MDMDLFFDLYFNFLSVKTEINKNNNKRLNLINLKRSDALKRQKYDTWLAMWLDHFKIDVIWKAFQKFLKLNSHISVFWGFWWISLNSEFSVLGIGLKTKTRKSRKIFSFLVSSSSSSLVVDNAVNLFNCFLGDFRDFRCFDLAVPNDNFPISMQFH